MRNLSLSIFSVLLSYSVADTPKLGISTSQQAGQLELEATQDKTYFLLSSDDLLTWTLEKEYVLGEGRIETSDFTISSSDKFFRYIEYDTNLDNPHDTDGDGIVNADELELGYHPAQPDVLLDTDGDKIFDEVEILHGLNPNNIWDALSDEDGDGLTNVEELSTGTLYNNVDTDGDLIPDGMILTENSDPDYDCQTSLTENSIYNTHPLLLDTDLDGLPDWLEIGNPDLDPLVSSDASTVPVGESQSYLESYVTGAFENHSITVY